MSIDVFSRTFQKICTYQRNWRLSDDSEKMDACLIKSFSNESNIARRWYKDCTIYLIIIKKQHIERNMHEGRSWNFHLIKEIELTFYCSIILKTHISFTRTHSHVSHTLCKLWSVRQKKALSFGTWICKNDSSVTFKECRCEHKERFRIMESRDKIDFFERHEFPCVTASAYL